MRPAVFLDRDDTLIANHAIRERMPHPGYLYDPELVELLPGAGEACAMLKGAGFALVVVTNQSSVARGWCSVEDIDATNARLRRVLADGAGSAAGAGVELDAVYTCLYSPDGTVEPYNRDHPWRKPQPGMLLWAADDLRLDLARSWMIGDAERDIVAGLRAGISADRTIVVGDRRVPQSGHHVPGMREAARIILGRVGVP